MRILACLIAWASLLITGAEACRAQASGKTLLEKPAEQEVEQATQLIRDVYKSEWERAKTPPLRLALARKLLDAGKETDDDPAGRFALYRIARDMGAQTGDIPLTFESIDLLAGSFRLDVLPEVLAATTKLQASMRNTKQREEYCGLLLPYVRQALAADQFDVGQQLMAVMTNEAKLSRNAQLIEDAAAISARIEQAATAFAKLAATRKLLEEKPADPQANLEVGIYCCYFKEDWIQGVPHLALCDKPALRDAAVAELTDVKDAAGQLQVADLWWAIADGETGLTQAALRKHAGQWYTKALPGLPGGLTVIKVEQRIAQSGYVPAARK